jgi:uncharacterized protein YuzE
MLVRYDQEADAAHIQLSSKRPQGGVEVGEGVILHITEKDDEIVAIEILDASKRFPIESLFTLKVAS